MITIGINVSHNSSACLMIDGEIKIAIQKEKEEKKKFYRISKKINDFLLNFWRKIK